MDYDRLFRIAEQARRRERIATDDQRFIRETVPLTFAAFPNIKYPPRIKHPAGFTVSGAVVRTFTRCALVLAAQRVLGRDYHKKSAFYDQVERDLAFGITLSNFRHGDPKGAFCCAICTLGVYPVLKAKAIRWLECTELADNVRTLIEPRRWRFSPSTNPKIVAWSLA